MRAIDTANEVGNLYISCEEELYNGIKNASRLQGSILASFWVGLTRLSLGEAEIYKINLPKIVTGQVLHKVATNF